MGAMSAGILLHRPGPDAGSMQVLIAHMGGPFWAAKDAGAWSIPKGEFDPAEEGALEAARREFAEELGIPAPAVDYAELGAFAYSSGRKTVIVYAGDGRTVDTAQLVYGEFEMEWPPRSGLRRRFPEVDRAEWMPPAEARGRLVAGQRPALDALVRHLAAASG